MRLALSVLACILIAGCNNPPQPKPSLYRYMTPGRVSIRSVCRAVSIHL
jgi:hypothetical protein